MSPTGSPRQFRPEPVETTARSSRKHGKEAADAAPTAARRFAPEPVETTVKSSRRLLPEPVETTARTSRDKHPVRVDGESKAGSGAQPTERGLNCVKNSIGGAKVGVTQEARPQPSESPKSPRRRFAPQLIETAKRSRKAGDTAPAVLPSDKTEVTPGDPKSGTKSTRRKREHESQKTENERNHVSTSQKVEEPQLRPPLGRSGSRGTLRKHSFRVPALESIESSDSDDSNVPSLATSLSTSSDLSSQYKHFKPTREGADDRVSDYLLHLATRSAEKQLEEQAMAAFPNPDHHEHVDHFMDRESDDDETIGLEREGSGSEVNWDLRAMLQHHDKLQRERQERRRSTGLDRTSTMSSTDSGPYGDPTAGFFFRSETPVSARDPIGGWQRDHSLDRMRSAACPPMLGGDIKFARCDSPVLADFDAALETPTSSIQSPSPTTNGAGLWQYPARCTLHTSDGPDPGSSIGLWRGLCDVRAQPSTLGPNGLMTPRLRPDDCPECVASPSYFELSPSPPEATSIDQRLAVEKAIQDEFDDAFVTQVYNYLSLGYPALARKFDPELSKISGTSVADLRQDDCLAQSRGYIRLGEGENGAMGRVAEETCVRWHALRIYIWEWARQQPLMSALEPGVGAVAIRRGSWAI